MIKKNILPIYLSNLLSKIGDSAHETIFAIIVIETLSTDFFSIGIVYFFRFIPFLFFGPIGGWMADNYNKKTIMICSDVIRCAFVLLLFFMYILNSLNIYILIISSMFMTIGRSIFQPSFRSIIPTLIHSKKDLVKSNSTIQVIDELSQVMGPLVCSFFIFMHIKPYVLFFDAASYILSSLLLLYIPASKSTETQRVSASKIAIETKEQVLKIINTQKELSITIIGSSLCILFTGALLRYILPFSILNNYHNEQLVGYSFSSIAIGTIVGGILYSSINRITNAKKLMIAWSIYGGIFSIIAVVIPYSFIAAIVICLFLGIAGAFVDISIVTNIQSLSSPNEIGKNFGLFSTLANTSESASGIFAGIISIASITYMFPILGLCIFTSGLIFTYKAKE